MLETAEQSIDELVIRAKADLAYHAAAYDKARQSGDIRRIERARHCLSIADNWLRMCLDVVRMEADDGDE